MVLREEYVGYDQQQGAVKDYLVDAATDLAKLNQSLMSCEELQSEEIQMELHNCLGSAKQSR